MESLFEQLKDYGEKDYYPYHMPGHKRNALGSLPEEIAQADITEIEGFDNLHQPEGILLKLQEKAAELYHAEQSFYLINGSTGGILSAISAATPIKGHILMARNSHKAAYHAAYLRNLNISYLYPPLLQDYDICDAVTPSQIEEAIKIEPDIQAVFVTSPTYEGRIADVAGIAEVVHKAGLPLIVDEAHGAHLGLAENFAKNSCQAGADIVIHSVHKTLPAMTQAALLHVNGNRVSGEKLQRFLHIYQTSSPSYILMASIDNALRVVEKQGTRLFAEFKSNFENMLGELAQCENLQFLPVSNAPEFKKDLVTATGSGEDTESSKKSPKAAMQDIGKLVISTKKAGISGQTLYHILLEKYHLQLEMASASYCLAMFTIGDSEEAYLRMTKALLEIDAKIVNKKKNRDSDGEILQKAQSKAENQTTNKVRLESPVTDLLEPNKNPAIPLARAWDGEKISVPLEQAAGCYAGEFINLYPPGVPLLVPGEQFTEKHCTYLAEYLRQGLNVQGIERKQAQYYVSVVHSGH
ncbi:MAG: aminotransferase class I/II-fold pyridoxal phosphate-dependent enzyme [Lachnoclostridium sp.]|nr:aminotransferase class I/II-fold pyridoxal phosphate-dependent enzyme [Lachnospira sp.]MCM1246960.1 aminotransferase class I/II-fold pyridoxal phosphate-dependent enzyme [Lachnoclostridium sp.]